MRDTITFQPNTPVTVTLQYAEGKLCDGRFGQRVMWGLDGDQVMFLDLTVAQQINMLEPQAGESITICKHSNGQKGQKARWDVGLSLETEKFRAAKEARRVVSGAADRPILASQPPSQLELQVDAQLRQIQERRAAVAERKPPESGPVAVPDSRPAAAHPPSGATPFSIHLMANTDALIDAYAACLEHANQHGNRVKPEDVRALLTTCYIAMTKNGVAHAA
jgi:hypothetical protein